MKGFIEFTTTNSNGDKREHLVPVRDILEVTSDDGISANLYQSGYECSFLVDETYDEIKKKIKEAQQEPVRLGTLNSFLHPDTPAAEGNGDHD